MYDKYELPTTEIPTFEMYVEVRFEQKVLHQWTKVAKVKDQTQVLVHEWGRGLYFRKYLKYLHQIFRQCSWQFIVIIVVSTCILPQFDTFVIKASFYRFLVISIL